MDPNADAGRQRLMTKNPFLFRQAGKNTKSLQLGEKTKDQSKLKNKALSRGRLQTMTVSSYHTHFMHRNKQY